MQGCGGRQEKYSLTKYLSYTPDGGLKGKSRQRAVALDWRKQPNLAKPNCTVFLQGQGNRGLRANNGPWRHSSGVVAFVASAYAVIERSSAKKEHTSKTWCETWPSASSAWSLTGGTGHPKALYRRWLQGSSLASGLPHVCRGKSQKQQDPEVPEVLDGKQQEMFNVMGLIGVARSQTRCSFFLHPLTAKTPVECSVVVVEPTTLSPSRRDASRQRTPCYCVFEGSADTPAGLFAAMGREDTAFAFSWGQATPSGSRASASRGFQKAASRIHILYTILAQMRSASGAKSHALVVLMASADAVLCMDLDNIFGIKSTGSRDHGCRGCPCTALISKHVGGAHLRNAHPMLYSFRLYPTANLSEVILNSREQDVGFPGVQNASELEIKDETLQNALNKV
ncbi:hypothetical protein B0H17DRAFT_1137907 [Mycena rosella]|uniref:Uncharacterized protein n=1 Tax=Mycena rosella TaxID=1033263 RepID=A0AAD7GA84_MYCRO|nr:hypothetical protein B0H17DRAFT_1137907 [Mycena rosella]